MKIRGHEIPDSVLNACTARMERGERFRASHIAEEARVAGCVNMLAVELASRLIQKWRKAGIIKRETFEHPYLLPRVGKRGNWVPCFGSK